ncbi:MAG: Lrp/AsnC family transcriptional regulator [Pseudomonadota bacterium]
MDTKDRAIIRTLQKHGRMTNQDLAEAVNLSPSPCLRRLRNLEASGAITGFAAEADPGAYGLPITVFVRICLERHNEEDVQRFEQHVQDMDEVLECYVLSGTTDYLMRAMVASLDAYESFIRRRIHPLGGIASIDTSFVYGTVKKTSVFPQLR